MLFILFDCHAKFGRIDLGNKFENIHQNLTALGFKV